MSSRYGSGITLDRWGMSADEAVSRARRWWNEIGRGLVPLAFNQEEFDKAMTAAKPGLPLMKTRGTERTVPSGILNGLPWDELQQWEQVQITSQWLSDHVKPQEVAPPDPDKVRRMHVECDHPLHSVNDPKDAVFTGPDDENLERQALEAGWWLTATADYCPSCNEKYMSFPDGALDG